MSYRKEVVADVEATISAHAPDELGACLGCQRNGDTEPYPCPPLLLALRAAELLTRRLAAGGDPGRQGGGAAAADLSRVTWLRPPASGNFAEGCVEVAFVGDAVALRHSDGPDGPIVIYARQEWETFVEGVRNGAFTR